MFLSLFGFILFIAFIGWLLEMWNTLKSLRLQINVNSRQMMSVQDKLNKTDRSAADLKHILETLCAQDTEIESLQKETNEIYECLRLLDDQLVELKSNTEIIRDQLVNQDARLTETSALSMDAAEFINQLSKQLSDQTKQIEKVIKTQRKNKERIKQLQ
jgi:chromosome segregation ATPase